VRILLPRDGGQVHNQIWSADSQSPRDQPQTWPYDIRTPSGTHWRISILRPGEVDAVIIGELDE
jgi:hypothetical protein